MISVKVKFFVLTLFEKLVYVWKVNVIVIIIKNYKILTHKTHLDKHTCTFTWLIIYMYVHLYVVHVLFLLYNILSFKIWVINLYIRISENDVDPLLLYDLAILVIFKILHISNYTFISIPQTYKTRRYIFFRYIC